MSNINPCRICNSPFRSRIEGWILSGLPVKTISNWCHELDPSFPADDHFYVDDHLDLGHIDINNKNTLAMFVKFNREAEEILEANRDNSGTQSRTVVNNALNVRMRTIELIARTGGVLGEDRTGPKTVNQNLTVMLPKEVQKQILETAIRRLDAPNSTATQNTGALSPISPNGEIPLKSESES